MTPRSLARSRPGLAACVATALALCAAAQPAQAYTLREATGSGWVSPDDAVNRLALVVDQQTLPGGAQSASGSQRLFMSNEVNGNASMASISGMSYADYGVLRARVDGEARVMPQGTNIPIYSDGTPRVEGGFGARFMDSITLYDPSLAIGAPVSYTFTVNIHVESNGAGHWGPQAAGYDTGSFFLHYFMGSNVDTMYMFPNGLYTSVPSYSVSLPVTLGGLNGDVLALGANLSLTADDRAGYYFANNFYWFYGLATETHLDASNTVRLFLDPVTPGLQFIAESGHNYASAPVPEPGSWALLGAGLALIGWRRRAGRGAARG